MSTSELEHSLNNLNLWLFFWTALVVVGLLIEYGELLSEAARRAYQKIFCGISPKAPILDLSLVGALLITVGVMGELWIEARTGSVEINLQYANAIEAIDLKYANTIEAITNEKAIIDLKYANDKAINDLKYALYNRTLTEEGQRRIGQALKSLAGTQIVTAPANPSDLEAKNLLDQIDATLTIAGVKIVRLTAEQNKAISSPLQGIFVVCGAMGRAHAQGIITALEAEYVQVFPLSKEDCDPSVRDMIIVGSRPAPRTQ
jgi:hypothetical protein